MHAVPSATAASRLAAPHAKVTSTRRTTPLLTHLSPPTKEPARPRRVHCHRLPSDTAPPTAALRSRRTAGALPPCCACRVSEHRPTAASRPGSCCRHAAFGLRCCRAEPSCSDRWWSTRVFARSPRRTNPNCKEGLHPHLQANNPSFIPTNGVPSEAIILQRSPCDPLPAPCRPARRPPTMLSCHRSHPFHHVRVCHQRKPRGAWPGWACLRHCGYGHRGRERVPH